MGCCGNQNHGSQDSEKQEHQHHGKQHSHRWIMMIGCILPIVLFAALILFNGAKGTGATALPLLLILLCPLSHMIMPLFMKKKDQHS
ncbi:hypothetical protein D3C75_1245470 [compost metagenome]